jgi:hypothetical protein
LSAPNHIKQKIGDRMPSKRKMWIYSPAKPKIPDGLKFEVSKKADEFVDSILKPKFVQTSPPKDERFNYIVDIYSKWHGSFFYLCAKYHSPGPQAISPYFEIKFARLEFVGNNHFALSFMRHTEQWWMLYPELTLDQCLKTIQEDPLFQP